MGAERLGKFRYRSPSNFCEMGGGGVLHDVGYRAPGPEFPDPSTGVAKHGGNWAFLTIFATILPAFRRTRLEYDDLMAAKRGDCHDLAIFATSRPPDRESETRSRREK
ncbi:hypothetical protein ACFOHS_05040 [Jhaorihella thermophila]